MPTPCTLFPGEDAAIYLNLTKEFIEVQRMDVEAKKADAEAKMRDAEGRRWTLRPRSRQRTQGSCWPSWTS
jgi:hypothetical protein